MGDTVARKGAEHGSKLKGWDKEFEGGEQGFLPRGKCKHIFFKRFGDWDGGISREMGDRTTDAKISRGVRDRESVNRVARGARNPCRSFFETVAIRCVGTLSKAIVCAEIQGGLGMIVIC